MVSLNSRLESNEEEEEARPCVSRDRHQAVSQLSLVNFGGGVKGWGDGGWGWIVMEINPPR